MTPEEIRNKIQELRREQEILEAKVSQVAQEGMPEYNSLWYVISDFWKCEKSPIGLCVYDDEKDQYHDDCIFCHNPEERK